MRILGYLSLSGILAYVASLLVNDSRAIFATPIINYALYSLAEELKGEGYIKAIETKNK